MNILAMDTSGNTGTVAVLKDGVILGEYTINYKKTHSQTLMVMIDELLKMTESTIDEMDAFAVSKGPGSFTGLRMGSATAKGFGLATGKPVIGVSSIAAMAYNFYASNSLICPIMDARRGQVYTGLYSFEDGKFNELLEPSAMAIEELIDYIMQNNKDNKAVIFLGDGVPVHKETINEKLSISHEFAYGNNNLQRASSLALLAGEMFEKGQYENAADHAPVYLRVSQAERERMEKLK